MWSVPEPHPADTPSTPLTLDRGATVVYALSGRAACDPRTGTDTTRDTPAHLSVDGTDITLPLPDIHGGRWPAAVKANACSTS